MAEKDYILKIKDLKTEFKVGKRIVHAEIPVALRFV